MNKIAIMDTFSRKAHAVNIVLKKHSPEILLGVGILSGLAATGMACYASTKLSDILKETNESVEQIHDYLEQTKTDPEKAAKYSEEDGAQDLAIVYRNTGLKVIKLYAPAVAVGIVSVTALLASNNIMRKRNAGLAVAYAAVTESYEAYRKGVIEQYGKDVDYNLRHGIKLVQVEEPVRDADGNIVEGETVTKTIKVMDPHHPSEYARFFDEVNSSEYRKDPYYNQTYICAQQTIATEKLRRRGYLFLNEVYAALGMEPTVAGQCIGWVYDESKPGGNYVDFGFSTVNRERNTDAANDFLDGYEPAILLDFNVDGYILDKVKITKI